MATVERLQKVMAKAGAASRRHSEELILRGHVRVNGLVVRELGYKVDPLNSKIEVMGRLLELQEPRQYVILNKPRGYITTVTDPFGRKTVMDLMSERFRGLYPVGRLDLDSEGLLLLTNDGELAFRLTHPRHKVAKKYLVEVTGLPSAKSLWRLRQGVLLEDGWTHPTTVRVVERRESSMILEIIISEGRKRQLRRMCRAVGHNVLSLQRLAIGPLSLSDLQPGLFRALTERELAKLRIAVDLR